MSINPTRHSQALCSIHTPINIMRIIFILILLNITQPLIACSCDWGGNFLTSAQYGELVIKGKVLERTFHLENGEQYQDLETALKEKIDKNLDEFYGMGESITIEIIEVLKGEENRQTIRIFDSDGADCRENISNFEIGKTYIFSTYQPKRVEPKLAGEKMNDYAINGCSENWLEYIPATNEVKGRIKRKSFRRNTIKYSYSKLTEKMNGA